MIARALYAKVIHESGESDPRLRRRTPLKVKQREKNSTGLPGAGTRGGRGNTYVPRKQVDPAERTTSGAEAERRELLEQRSRQGHRMDSRSVRQQFFNGLFAGLRIVWPILSGLLGLVVAFG